MSQISDQRLVLEALADKTVTTTFDFEKDCFPQQLAFIKDPAKLKSAFCTRRAGKSFTASLYLISEAYQHVGVSCLFIGLTRLSAKAILWKDCLKVINRTYNLGITFNETALTATLPNGSVIYLIGADSNEEEKQKLLGQKYKICIIDEAASYSINLRELVYSILKPAVADYRGTICMVGTPGNFTKGLFFDVTNGTEPGWSAHRWTTFDSPYMAVQWKAEIEELTTSNPHIVETPWFKQMYLGQWVVDSSKLVYRYNSERNTFSDLPKLTIGQYHYVLGIDLGHSPDPSAFSVCAYQPHDPNLYVVETHKGLEMDITDVANKIKELDVRFSFDHMVVDNAAKQAVEEIKRRHGLPLKAADKAGKFDFIEIMNSEFIQGKIKLHIHKASELADEYLGLICKTKGGELVLPKEEHPGCPNHLADSLLYAWRYCYQYLWEKREEKDIPGSDSWKQHQEKEMEQRSEADYMRRKEQELEDSGEFSDGNSW